MSCSFPSRGSSDQGIEPVSSALAGRFFTTEPLGEPGVTILAYSYISVIDYVIFLEGRDYTLVRF